MLNIALVYSFDESSWFSCTKIIANLLKAYQLIDSVQLSYHNFSSKKDGNVSNLAEEILQARPDKIVFLDHKPHPLKLLKEIYHSKNSYEGELIFHIYGDFTLMFDSWLKLDQLLLNKKVKFICASDRQVELLKQFIQRNEIVQKIPFPVDIKEFYPANNQNPKNHMDSSSDDKILLYTGRLSLQKNIHILCDEFLKALSAKTISPDYKLVIVGEVDALGFPFASEYQVLGEYYRLIDRTIQKHDSQFHKNIIFTGKVSHQKLLAYYQNASYFVSMSTYHDEDFGMSVAEAGATGLPLILSKWAGYASFASEQTQFVRTNLGSQGPYLELDDLQRIFSRLKSLKVDRAKQSQFFAENFSIEAVAKNLRDHIKSLSLTFSGFSDLMYLMGRIQQNGKFVFYNNLENSMNKNYFKVYGVYAG
jgi:glycosyltransferase involved in cell wall biosynthesis